MTGWPANPTLSVDAFQLRLTALEVTEVAVRPVGTVGGCVSPPPYAWNTAAAAYQSVAAAKVARASCAPAALASTSSMSADPELVWARMVKARPCEDPGVTDPGDPPVMMPPTTSSPAPTAPVGPESTEVLLPFAAAA